MQAKITTYDSKNVLEFTFTGVAPYAKARLEFGNSNSSSVDALTIQGVERGAVLDTTVRTPLEVN